MIAVIVIVIVMLSACTSEPNMQPIGDVNRSLNVASLSAGVISQIAMAAVCLLFVVLAVRSFIEARRERNE